MGHEMSYVFKLGCMLGAFWTGPLCPSLRWQGFIDFASRQAPSPELLLLQEGKAHLVTALQAVQVL